MKDSSEVLSLLEKHSLRKTSIRTDVLSLFLEKPFALSHSDIENTIGNQYDRVTIYRTLHSFEERGLIHKVNDESGIFKYALCQENCNDHVHQDNHIHFYCTNCGHTYCLDQIEIPEITLPSKYSAENFSFTVSGKCKSCNV